MKKTILLIIISILLISSPTLACVGARPLGMGGAFIALADDINSIYWNPAGLANLYQLEASYTRTLNKRTMTNYDDFFALGGPWHYGQYSGGWALGYIGGKIEDPITAHSYLDRWLDLGGGINLTKDLALGANLRYYFGNQRDASKISYAKSYAWEWDLAMQIKTLYPLQIGILLQNVNQPTLHFPDYPSQNRKIALNIRPAISYHFSPRTIITADIYDLANKHEEGTSLHLGWEHQWKSLLTTRAGLYKGNLSLGLSLGGPQNIYDYTYVGGAHKVHYFAFTKSF